MANALRRLLSAALVGAAFLGLWLKGADGPALSGLFSLLVASIALLAVIIASPQRVALTFTRHGFALAALLGFACWALYLAFWPQPGAFAHPQWSLAGFDRGYLSIAPHRTLEGLAQLVSAPAAFLAAALLVRDRNDKDAFGALIAFGAIVFAAYALFSRLTHMGEGAARLDVHFGSPNAAALAFAMAAIVAAALAVRVMRQRIGESAQRTTIAWATAPLAFGALALSLTALLLTASRAGIPAGMAGLVLFFVLMFAGRPTRGTFSWLSVTPLALIALLAGAGGIYAWERLDLLEPDANLRADLVSAHWRLFLERPITGHGLNTFHELHQLTLSSENWREMQLMGSAHNIFVQALEETGIVGFALLGLAIASIMWRLARLVLARDSGSDWAAAAFAVWAVGLAHGLVDFGLQLPAIAALAAMLAGAFSSASEPQR